MKEMPGNTWQTLLDAGLVSGSPQATKLESPWYVRLMLGVAGWIAAIFLLGFFAVFITRLFDKAPLMMGIGVALLLVASLALRFVRSGDFVEQFALAISFCGQFMVNFGIFDLFDTSQHEVLPWTISALVQIALLVLMPNSIHRLWSAFAAAVALSIALQSTALYFVFAAVTLALTSWCWLNEFRWLDKAFYLRPVTYGLTLALAVINRPGRLLQSITGFNPDQHSGFLASPWPGHLLAGAVLLGVVWCLLRRQGIKFGGLTANTVLAGAGALVLASVGIPGIIAGICVMLLGFANGNRLLTGLGIIAMLFYTSYYYYSLEATLLVKSQALAVMGIALLAIRWAMIRWLSPTEGVAYD
jgi:uncharacterized membrane protein